MTEKDEKSCVNLADRRFKAAGELCQIGKSLQVQRLRFGWAGWIGCNSGPGGARFTAQTIK